MNPDELTGEAKRLIDAIAATPRFAGSAEESRARAFCAAELRNSGYTITEREFDFSEWPGRWGIPLVSALLVMVTAVTAAGASRSPQLGGLAFVLTFYSGARIFRSRRDSATAQVEWLRSRATNLEAKRGSPRVWLVAHLDSKSQSVPMLVRVASHVTLIAVLAFEMAMLFLAQWGAVRTPHWSWIVAAAVVAALPSLFCHTGNASRGALDNATGVVAILLAAKLIPPEKAVGVLVTSGEELDLAGARAWAGESHPGMSMINCDTVDDEGEWRCMCVKAPNAISTSAAATAKKLGLRLRMGKVISGIITDSLAFEKSGLRSVTISRGTLRTLARLHTRGDNADHLSGAGAATAARLLAGMVEELS